MLIKALVSFFRHPHELKKAADLCALIQSRGIVTYEKMKQFFQMVLNVYLLYSLIETGNM